MRLTLSLLLCCFCLLGMTQQASYYTLGKGAMEGVDVYDIHQGNDGAYWIATDKGMLRYDSYSFSPMPCSDMQSVAMFGLTEDHRSRVYCHNLSGQVFLIENGQCRLFYTLPDSVLTSDISLQVDDQNRLVILARRTLIIDSTGKAKLVPNSIIGPSEVYRFVRTPNDKALYGYNMARNTLLSLQNGQWTEKPLHRPPAHARDPIVMLALDHELYAYNQRSNDILSMSGDTLQIVASPATITGRQQNMRDYSTIGTMWLATNTFGVLKFELGQHPLQDGQVLFRNRFISCIHEDHEGNILLGTFGNGILVVTNPAMEDITTMPTDEEMISIARSESGDMFFGTRSGKIYHMDRDEQVSLFRSEQVKSVELLEPLADDHLLIGELEGKLINISTGEESTISSGSIKDVSPYTQGKYLLATNNGAVILDLFTRSLERIDDLKLRLYCIAYDSLSGTVYAGTSRGLVLWNEATGQQFFRWGDARISARDLEYHNGRMLVGTAGHGLLIFVNDTLEQQFSQGSLIQATDISRIKRHHPYLYLATDKGIEVLNEKYEPVRVINRSDGLHSENIEDFEIRDKELWIAYGQGVQRLQIDQLSSFDYTPELYLHATLVNDASHIIKNGETLPGKHNNLRFELRVNNLRYQRDIYYLYQLEGAEQEWHRLPFENNVINFSSLAPGTYTLQALAQCRDHSSAQQSLTFTIAAPFWMHWWFYLGSGMLLLAIVSLIYKRQLRAQRKKARQINEINASKLTAIQSQMNPHFIFNALNSIQDLVLKGDIDNSYTYITLFADLVRRTLKASESDFIELQQEIKLIELYLGLEKLRFKGDLEYSIDAPNLEDVMIPPMLIQPFIENALVHGLLHKKGAKRITIQFELDSKLHCIITDNGVGRAKAEEIKARRRKDHESFSVRAIRKRFEILKDHFSGEFGFSYQDLIEDGEACGTRLVLVIPMKRVL